MDSERIQSDVASTFLQNYFVKLVAFLALYLVFARIGVSLATINEVTSPVWPATGVAMAVLFLFGLRFWPVVFLGAFIINSLSSLSFLSILSIATGNTLEALVGAVVLFFFSQKKYQAETHSRTLAIVLASIIGASISSMVGTLTLILSGASPGEMFDQVWLTWWTGDSLGGIVVLPLVFSFVKNSFSLQDEVREAPGIFMSLALIFGGVLLCWLLFFQVEGAPYLFFIFPYMLWCAAQAGERGSSLATILISFIGVLAVKFGYGVFLHGTTNTNLINLQVFLASVGISSLMMTDLKRISSLKQPGLVLLFSWIFASLLFLGFFFKNSRDSDDYLKTIVEGVEPLLESKMNNYFFALQSGASLFTASDKVTQEEWISFLEYNQFQKQLPALRGLGVVFRIPKNEIESFIKKNELRKGQDFEYHAIPGVSPEEASQNALLTEAYLVTYIEPFDDNRLKAGLDLATEEQRRMAAEYARDTGEPAITGKIKLIDDPDGQPAMLAYYPFYGRGEIPKTVAERRERLIGWTYAPVMTDQFFSTVFQQGNLKEISFKVSEDSSGKSTLITATPGYDKLPGSNEIIKKVRFGNHDFVFQFKGTAAFYASRDSFSSRVGAVAAIISLLLGTLIVSLQAMKKRAINFASQTTEELKASEELWKFALEGAGDAVWDWDIETGKVLFSRRLNSLLGYEEGELDSAEIDWPTTVHPEDLPRVRANLAAHFNGEQSFITECRLLCKNGSYKWVLARGMMINNKADDKPHRMVGTISDISSQKDYEYEIQRQRAKAHSIFEGSSDALMLLTMDGRFFDCNSRTLKLFGFEKKAEFLSLHPSDLSPEFQPDGGDSETMANNHMRKAFNDGVNHFEWVHCRKNGKCFPAEVLLTAFSYDGRTVLQACVRDISERKHAEAILSSQREKLVASAKMSSLGEMAGGIAHEINNPLTIIIGKTSLLKRRIEGSDNALSNNFKYNHSIAEELTNIQNTAKRIGSIIRGLRSFSRNAENDQMERIQVSGLIDETLDFSRERFKFHAINLKVQMDEGDSLFINGRAAELLQVLVNLLNNAYDAVEPLKEKWVEINVGHGEGICKISVTDSGDGIDPEVLDKIMMPFFTTKEVGKGTGLGLSISKGIIENHRGRFYYDTASAHTSFVIELPLT